MKFYLFVLLIVFGVGYTLYKNPPPPPDPNSPQERLRRGETILVATAPDGTKLWKVERDGEAVFFSTAGTSRKEAYQVGKITHYRDVRVPASQ